MELFSLLASSVSLLLSHSAFSFILARSHPASLLPARARSLCISFRSVLVHVARSYSIPTARRAPRDILCVVSTQHKAMPSPNTYNNIKSSKNHYEWKQHTHSTHNTQDACLLLTHLKCWSCFSSESTYIIIILLTRLRPDAICIRVWRIRYCIPTCELRAKSCEIYTGTSMRAYYMRRRRLLSNENILKAHSQPLLVDIIRTNCVCLWCISVSSVGFAVSLTKYFSA